MARNGRSVERCTSRKVQTRTLSAVAIAEECTSCVRSQRLLQLYRVPQHVGLYLRRVDLYDVLDYSVGRAMANVRDFHEVAPTVIGGATATVLGSMDQVTMFWAVRSLCDGKTRTNSARSMSTHYGHLGYEDGCTPVGCWRGNDGGSDGRWSVEHHEKGSC